MDEITKYYFNHDNFSAMIQSLKEAEVYMASSYEKLLQLQNQMLADEEWKNMGKDESIGFLNIIVQMHKDISGINEEDTTGVVPSMIKSLETYIVNMEDFYDNSQAYKNMINKTY